MSIAAERELGGDTAFAFAEELRAAGDARRRRRTRGWLTARALIAADVAGLSAAVVAAELIFASTGSADEVRVLAEVLLFLATLPGWVVIAKLFRLYDNDDQRADHTTVEDLLGVFLLVTVGAWFVFVGALVTGMADPNLPKLASFWAIAIASVTTARVAARTLVRRSALYNQKAIVVGAGDVGQLVGRKLIQHPEYGIELVGFVDPDPRPKRPEVAEIPVLGAPEDLSTIVDDHEIDRVIVAFSGAPLAQTVETLRMMRGLGLQVDIVPRLFEVVGPHVRNHTLEGIPLVALPETKRFPLSHGLKRAFDIVVAASALTLAGPLLAWIAWRVHRDSPGPVLFRQRRVGRDMRDFTLLKFRTMRVDVDTSAHREYIAKTMSSSAAVGKNGLYKLDRSDAVTPFGRWLRKTSLDELPQLWNVLRGEMSLVGPRPCLRYETEHFAPHHFERFLVKPGITGLWQVTARAHATFGEALDMDVAYARNWSLGLDLWLLCRTPHHLLRRGATA